MKGLNQNDISSLILPMISHVLGRQILKNGHKVACLADPANDNKEIFAT